MARVHNRSINVFVSDSTEVKFNRVESPKQITPEDLLAIRMRILDERKVKSRAMELLSQLAGFESRMKSKVTSFEDHTPKDEESLRVVWASFLLLGMSKRSRDSFIGDLDERFRLKLKEGRHRTATLWFWHQVILSWWSLALDVLKRVSGFEKLLERSRRIGF